MSDIALLAIRADVRAQPRASTNTDIIAEYAEAMTSGAEFPPLIVFHDAEAYWLADGFHRFYAAQGAERQTFPCEVREGGLRDAILFSVGANAAHGYRRSDEDKRRAVDKLLNDQEWSHWSDREIARQCGVSHELVRKRRPEPDPVTVNADSEPPMRTYTTKHGTTGTMNTSAIGRRYQPEATPRSEPRPTREPEPWSLSDVVPTAAAEVSVEQPASTITPPIPRAPR